MVMFFFFKAINGHVRCGIRPVLSSSDWAKIVVVYWANLRPVRDRSSP